MSTPQQSLAGRTVVVTGGSRGLGRAMALAVARAGADVVVTARTESGLRSVRDEIGALGRRCAGVELDLAAGARAIEAGVDRIWKAAGAVDAVFNNAGITLYKPCLETTEADWDSLVATNLTGVYYSCQSFGRRLLAQGRGKIVNVASDLGIRGERNWSAYSATKGAIVTLTKSLAWEWAPTLTVNVIAPGPFYTDANRAMFDQPAIRATVEDLVPLHRIGDAERDLGPLVVLLSGPGSDFMTGAVFRVDGGICRS